MGYYDPCRAVRGDETQFRNLLPQFQGHETGRMYEVPLKRSAHAKLHGIITQYTTIGILVHIPVIFILSHSVGISQTVR